MSRSRELARRLGQSLEHEGVVTRLGPGQRIRERKSHERGDAEPICGCDGGLERGVEYGALRLLHPVQHVVAGTLRRIIQLAQALRLDHHQLQSRPTSSHGRISRLTEASPRPGVI